MPTSKQSTDKYTAAGFRSRSRMEWDANMNRTVCHHQAGKLHGVSYHLDNNNTKSKCAFQQVNCGRILSGIKFNHHYAGKLCADIRTYVSTSTWKQAVIVKTPSIIGTEQSQVGCGMHAGRSHYEQPVWATARGPVAPTLNIHLTFSFFAPIFTSHLPIQYTYDRRQSWRAFLWSFVTYSGRIS